MSPLKGHIYGHCTCTVSGQPGKMSATVDVLRGLRVPDRCSRSRAMDSLPTQPLRPGSILPSPAISRTRCLGQVRNRQGDPRSPSSARFAASTKGVQCIQASQSGCAPSAESRVGPTIAGCNRCQASVHGCQVPLLSSRAKPHQAKASPEIQTSRRENPETRRVK